MRKLGNKELYVLEDKDIVSLENIRELISVRRCCCGRPFPQHHGFEECSNEFEAPPSFLFIRADIALWASIDMTC